MRLKKTILPAALTLLLVLQVRVVGEESTEGEAGAARMSVVYPGAGAEIDNAAPMITADFTGLRAPADPAAVKMLVDGADVTDSADVTVNYILYKPPEDMEAGRHEVRVTARDVNGKEIEPLDWSFNIKAPEPLVKIKKKEPDLTTGKLVVVSDYSRADYESDPVYRVVEILEEKEGMKLNVDFDFSNVSEGRTLVGAYHRETQFVTDKEIDKFRLNYFDDRFEASLGHFWVNLSRFTIAGAEMGGVKLDRNAGPWSFSFFSGRTQDPSTSGSFKQVTTGVAGSFRWDRRNTTSLTHLFAQERNDDFHGRFADPSDDRITSLRHEYRLNKDITAGIEAASNVRREGNAAAEHDSAFAAGIEGSYKRVYGEAEVYSIGGYFVPVAGGNAKFQNNNKDGFRGKGRARIAKWLSAGGEYEQYDRDTFGVAGAVTEDTTKRGNAFVAVSAGSAADLRYNYAKMTVTTGVVSESDLVSAMLRVRKAGGLKNTVFGANWQDVDYRNGLMVVNTRSLGLSFKTWFGRRLGFSAGYSDTDTDSIFQNVLTENEKYYFGVEWRLRPERLTLTGRYETSDVEGRNYLNGGVTADQREWRLKTMLRVAGRLNYSYLLGYDMISRDDEINRSFSYDQGIFRSGVEKTF